MWLQRERTRRLFRLILSNRKKRWVFNQSALFMEFLMGLREFTCTPWGMPTYNLFGWQRPCYVQQDGYAETFRELIEDTDWSQYGPESGNPKCANCMMHSGFEATAVHHTFSGWRGLAETVRATFSLYPDPQAEEELVKLEPAPHPWELVQIGGSNRERAS
jgi:hypothetical protein